MDDEIVLQYARQSIQCAVDTPSTWTPLRQGHLTNKDTSCPRSQLRRDKLRTCTTYRHEVTSLKGHCLRSQLCRDKLRTTYENEVTSLIRTLFAVRKVLVIKRAHNILCIYVCTPRSNHIGCGLNYPQLTGNSLGHDVVHLAARGDDPSAQLVQNQHLSVAKYDNMTNS